MNVDTLLASFAVIFVFAASIPSLYFTYVFLKRDKKKALLSFLLFNALFLHAIYHITLLMSTGKLIQEILEFLSALMILFYAIDHFVTGRRDN